MAQTLTISNDAPHGDINWLTMSFLTPDKITGMANTGILGFRVYDGYTTLEMADLDAKRIAAENINHDIYVTQMGRIHAWDDSEYSENVEYRDPELNELQRRHQKNIANAASQGIPTHHSKPVELAPLDTTILQLALPHQDQDYLVKQSDTSSALNYGCITIYSPRHIHGLARTCFKIRGLYEDLVQAQTRAASLKQRYPHDNIYIFQVGLWSAYDDDYTCKPETSIIKLNYCMMRYNQYIAQSHQEFQARKQQETQHAMANPPPFVVSDIAEKNVPQQTHVAQHTQHIDDMASFARYLRNNDNS